MILDAHIHMYPFKGTLQEHRIAFDAAFKKVGFHGGAIFSMDPLREGKNLTPRERIQALLSLIGGRPEFFAMYWISPLDGDALQQVALAKEMGVTGIKIICEDCYPSDARVISICRDAAARAMPVMFHSGINWDGKASGHYNRPTEFECMLDVPGLRFSVAHVGWPWTDECIAVFGKFCNAYTLNPDVSCEMFIDLSPGTPRVCREDVIKKLFLCDYQPEYNTMFGTDCFTNNYNTEWAKEWQQRDNDIYRRLNLFGKPGFIEHVYCENFLRFVGKSTERIERPALVPAGN